MGDTSFFKLGITICFLAAAVQVAGSPVPDDPKDPPPMNSDLVCKYVYITHPGCSVDSNITVIGEMVEEISSEFQALMNDQAHGYYTFTISTIADISSGPNVFSWEAEHTQNHYLTHSDSMFFNENNWADGAIGEVNAETVDKIIDTYSLEGEENPFLDADYVFFIYGFEMWKGYKGKFSTYLLQKWTDQDLMKSTSGFHTSRDWGDRDLEEMLKTLSAHELGHSFFSHPSLDDPGAMATYGAYGAMRTPLIFAYSTGTGLFSYSAFNKFNAGWLDGTVVTEEDTSMILYDSQSTNRNTIVIPLSNCGGQNADERFILSYHTQSGHDKRHPGRGLQIWHNIGAWSNDIEAASGRKKVGDTSIGDPINGVDKLDRAYYGEQSPEWENWFNYGNSGYEDDFFDVDDTVTYPDGVEFSYRTNPSTWGSEGISHAAPQSVMTSLYILATRRDSVSIFVDVYPTPREEILSPVAEDVGRVGHSTVVSWDNFFFEDGQDSIDVLNDVEIWFSPHDGVPYSYRHVGTADYYDFSFDWIPTDDLATTQGKVKLVFDNNVNDLFSETVMEGSISIVGTATPWETIISPNGGENLFVDVPTDIRWTNFYEDGTTLVDILLSQDGGSSWQIIVSNADYQTAGDYDFFSWTPASNFIGNQMRIKLEFTFLDGSIPQYSEAISEENFGIYPLGASFSDVTATSNVNYDGTPYSAVSLEYTSDDFPDMFITLQTDSGGSEARLYKNIWDDDNLIEFLDRTPNDFQPGSETLTMSRGLSVGDFDNDNAPDIFVTHADIPQLFKFENGQFRNVINDSTYFDETASSLLNNSYCVTWVDFDHDGDLDFYLGRATEEEGIGGSKAPLFNTLFENRLPHDTFLEVGRTFGLVDTGNPSLTFTAAWSDFDNDNLWEVVVGDFDSQGSGGPPVRLYTQNTDQSFSLETSPFPGVIETDLVNSLEWVDADQDGDLDLLMVRSASRSYVALNNQGQLSGAITLSGENGWVSSCGTSWDFNLDGFPDFLLGNETDASPPRLLENLLGYSAIIQQPTLDVASEVGLGDGFFPVQGILTNDFNGDGDLDLFLGRQEQGIGRIFQNQHIDGTDAPENNFRAIKLSSPFGVNNTMGIGSVVRLYGGPPSALLGTQHVDGGSGRGGQAGNTLIFGMGNHSAIDSLVVHWPNGFRQMIPSLSTGSVTTVLDQSAISIVQGSVNGAYVIIPNSSSADLIFQWDTDVATPWWKDEVTIQGASCYGQEIILTSDSPNVENSVSRNTDGSYHHVFKWKNQPCIPTCIIEFTVLSGAGNTVNGNAIETESTVRSFSFSVCGKPYNPSQ